MVAECAVNGCKKPSFCRGYCNMHYSRWRRHGRPGEAKAIREKGRKCAFVGCDSPSRWVGYCVKHASRLKKYGDPSITSIIIGDDETRFWQKVDKNGPVPDIRPDLGPCWTWTSFITPDGYGRFWYDGKNAVASRYSYELENGPLPADLQPDHLCRNRACINPSHLEAVTVPVNLLRGEGAAAKNARKTHCKRGHPFDSDNTQITKTGARQCRICLREKTRRYRARKASAGA